MNAGPTSERIYAALKRLIQQRRFRPGEKLDPGRLADALGSSVTPVRDALHILTGEGLVETRTSDGYAIPLIDEPGLKDLYRWSAALLALALRIAPLRQGGPASAPDTSGPDRSAALFDAIARATDNAECVRAIAALNDRTMMVRHVEPAVIDGTESETEAMAAAWARGDRRDLRRQIAAYHRRRERRASAILRAMYRAPPDNDAHQQDAEPT